MDYGKIIVREDGSYVITKSGMPYHVPNSRDYKDLWKDVDAYAKSNPECVTKEPPYVVSLAEQKAAKLAEINSEYNAATSSLVATYPSTELLTFDKQENEARVWKSDNSVATPFLDGLAKARGIDKAELVDRVIAKADVFQTAVATLTGLRQKYEDQLGVATTAEEIEAIVPEYSV